VFVRLCDVDADGKSWNVCDGLTSVTEADSPGAVTVTLWSTAYRFKRGHRIRVQVSQRRLPPLRPQYRHRRAACHRAPPASADQSVYHDESRPSAITLPVRGDT